MRKPPVFAVEKQNPRQCLCLWRKHKSDGKKQENVLKNKNINDDLKNLAMENDKDFDAYIEKFGFLLEICSIIA